MNHIKKLKETNFLFITGIEGSGTTMMLKLLDAVAEVAVLGGNYWTPELGKEAHALNKLTAKLWNEKKICSRAEKKEIFEKIRELELPSHYTHVVHKRSFPFLDTNHFPHLVDCKKMARFCRILNMRRDHAANSRSILRRGFESDNEMAAMRTETAVKRLEIELEALGIDGIMHIDYESVIDIYHKDKLLGKLADLLDLDSSMLKRNAHIITEPTPTVFPV